MNTLRVLQELFKKLDFLPFDPEKARSDLTNELVEEFYNGNCPILEKLCEYEALEVGFDTMKNKETILRSV